MSRQFRSIGIVTAEDDTVRLHKVFHGRPLLEKLRVGYNGNRVSGQFRDDPADLSGGPYRHRAFVDNGLGIIHGLADRLSRCHDLPAICLSIFSLRRAHRDEDNSGLLNCRLQSGCKGKPLFFEVSLYEFLESRLVE